MARILRSDAFVGFNGLSSNQSGKVQRPPWIAEAFNGLLPVCCFMDFLT